MARIDPFIEALFTRNASHVVLATGERASLAFGDDLKPVTAAALDAGIMEKLLDEMIPPTLARTMRTDGEHEFTYESPAGAVTIRVLRNGGTLRFKAYPVAPTAGKAERPAAAAGEEVTGLAADVTPTGFGDLDGSDRGTGAVGFDSGGGAGNEIGATTGGDTSAMDALFHEMVKAGCSDLHLCSDCPPLFRKDGGMTMLSSQQVLSAEAVTGLLRSIAPDREWSAFTERHDVDFSYEIAELGRFRCNYFVDRKGMGGVFRVIPVKILTTEDLGLSEHILKLCNLSKGLVVVTGPTGSGKSTTLAAMIDYINRNRSEHIITIEDPIEFVHPNKKCLINQREVGHHTNGFKTALRAALREDPDIVLVGEMRDLETVEIAIETAETGHLVFGTLHTNTAPSTVDRIIDQFPADRQSQIRTMLASSLKGVIAQTLCKKKGGGRVAALEVLIVNHAISNLIREGKTFQIPSIMQTGAKLGMSTLNEALFKLVQGGTVDADEAMAKAVDKVALADLLKRKAPAEIA